MNVEAIRSAGAAMADFFVPRHCLVCGKQAHQWRAPVCLACTAELAARRVAADRRVELKSFLSVADSIDAVCGLYAYSEHGALQALVHAMKYRGGQSLCTRMGREIGAMLREEGSLRPQVFIPVPIHPARLRERRYNQSQRIAEGMSEVTGIPLDGAALRRTRKTSPQAFLGSLERADNVRDAFRLGDLRGRKECVGLVDDVVTTGATVSACASLLKEAGVRRVVVFCVAVAQADAAVIPQALDNVDMNG